MRRHISRLSCSRPGRIVIVGIGLAYIGVEADLRLDEDEVCESGAASDWRVN